MRPHEGIWDPTWLHTEAQTLRVLKAWRGVETQYASATSLLVDTLEEHDLLEALLEQSKPPLPPGHGRRQHFLLTAPFRYTPTQDSRFRRAGQLGIWYGALQLHAACAEVAWWRMRFVADSAGLQRRRVITHHTFFAAAVRGRGVDLTQAPWRIHRQIWMGDDYGATQVLADAVTGAGLELIQYESARAQGADCLAVFTPRALREPHGGLDATRQKWVCTATQDRAMMRSERHADLRFEWP